MSDERANDEKIKTMIENFKKLKVAGESQKDPAHMNDLEIVKTYMNP